MAEVYQVNVGNQAPVEFTGGRVGWFYISRQPGFSVMLMGGQAMSISYPGGNPAVTNGVALETLSGGDTLRLYVTSPDDIYLVRADYNGGVANSTSYDVFHNR